MARGPEWAAAITGLPVAQIEAFARLYCTTQRSYIRIGYGFARMRNGVANMHAVSCLPTVTGKWQYEGAGALWSNRGMYHWDKRLIEGIDALDPSIRVLDMSRVGSVLTGDRSELRDGPQVHAMLIQNQNPLTVCPDSNRVRRGFSREDLFVCVHEQFMTETARWADVVLPATMFMEHDDLYQAGGHTHIQIGPKLIEPPGECRSNHEVLQGLARRLGAKHRGFDMTAMEIIDETLRASGWPDAATVLRERWIDAALPFEQAHFLTGFPAAGQEVPLRTGLGFARTEPRVHAAPAGSHGMHRSGDTGIPVPPGDGAGAQLPEHQLHRDAEFAPAGAPADGADASGRCRTPGDR